MDAEGSNETPSQAVARVFREVWEEFHEWKDTDARLTIGSFARPKPRVKSRSGSHGGHLTGGQYPPTTDASAHYFVRNYTTSGRSKLRRVPAETIDIELTVNPHPAYESCAPAGSNFYVGDDPHDMPFMPFADDPTFDPEEYMSTYSRFAWQSLAVRDPDKEFIVLETAARLQERYSWSLEKIDATAVLPTHLLGERGVSIGLVHKGLQRDYIHWPKATPTRLRNSHNQPVPDTNDLYDRLRRLNQNFCPNLDCIHPFCMTHINVTHMPTPQTVRRSQKSLAGLVKTPCHRQCFKLHAGWTESETDWSASDIKDLQCLLKVDVNMFPCDLAILMHKACREVFVMLPGCLPPVFHGRVGPQKTHGISELSEDPATSAPTDVVDEYIDIDSLTPNEPCRHAGPCGILCPCFQNKAHCERNCHCPPRCKRRWRGCKCKKGTKICGTLACPCYKTDRECDPELCGPCKARGRIDGAAGRCQNVSIQQGAFATVETREGPYGLGLHVLQVVPANSLVIEYTGEVIASTTTASRDAISRHRRRNYLYGLNESFDLDSGFAGNEARYINHGSDDQVNCQARVRLVNGDQRIGVFATRDLVEGEELFLDYGPSFFPNV